MENQKSGMIQVAICDKEPLILERLEELVKKEMKETGKPFNICYGLQFMRKASYIWGNRRFRLPEGERI